MFNCVFSFADLNKTALLHSSCGMPLYFSFLRLLKFYLLLIKCNIGPRCFVFLSLQCFKPTSQRPLTSMALSTLSEEVHKAYRCFLHLLWRTCRKCWVSISSSFQPSRTENNGAPAVTVLLEWQSDCWKIVINKTILYTGDSSGAANSGAAYEWM